MREKKREKENKGERERERGNWFGSEPEKHDKEECEREERKGGA